jgi:class 3 adenylate cyclase/tetratricopeptide (TPR) repeat protein
VPICAHCGHENSERAKFCEECAAPLAESAPSAQGERRRTVTVLFCDLVGSTALADRIDPEVLRATMGRYHAELRTVVERHEGRIEKFVGDAAMAVFGLPEAHEDDGLRAVLAAAEIRQAVARLDLEARIGINTGEVVSGGGETLVTGDAVNVAARLEQVAQPGEILLGPATERLAREAIVSEPLGPLVLKGKSEPVPAHRLVEVSSDAPAFSRRIDAPLVGRERELESLARTVAAAVEGREPQLATIVGPPGIGKSRLARELVARSQARVLVGRCLSYGEGITYWPLAEIVRQVGDLRAALGDDPDAESAIARIGAALGEGSASSDEIAWSFRKLFEALARGQPTIIGVDDIHWAEPTLLDLLEYVAAFAREVPLLLLCIARPELYQLRPAWAAPKPNTTLVTLEPLAEEHCELLVEALGEIGDETKALIVEAAEGNPLFVEQLVAHRAENGNGQLEIPPTVQALLAARIDRLEGAERGVIERASVEGRFFHRGSVQELLPEQARAGVVGHLLTLVRKDFVQPDRSRLPGDDGFRFGHLLIRDAAYDSIPKRLRAELHEHFAGWLQSRLGSNASDEILGYHLEQAYRYRAQLGQADATLGARAGRLLGAAGRRALARSDMAAAERLLSRAVGLLPTDDPERTERLLGLSVALRERGEFERAAEVGAEAAECAESAGLRGLTARARLNDVFLRLYTEPTGTDELVATAEETLPIFEELGDDEGLAQALWFIAVSHWNRCRVGRMDELAERALVHAERANAGRWLDQIVAMRGLASVGGPLHAEDALRRCAELQERSRGSRGAVALLNAYAGVLEAMRGRFDLGREKAARSSSMLEDLGRRVTAAGACYFFAQVELLAGDAVRAEEILRPALETLEALGETVNSAIVAMLLAEALCRQERFEEAEEAALVSERTAWPDDLIAQVGWRSARAQARAALGERDRGEALAREAIELLADADNLDLRGDAFIALGLTLTGDARRAAFREAEALYEAKGNIPSAQRARHLS